MEHTEIITPPIASQNKYYTEPAKPALKEFFFSELNLALAIPFKERVRGKIKGKSESVVRVCDDESSRVLKIATRCSRGAISSMAYDVLMCLLDMATDQLNHYRKVGTHIDENNFKVYFSYREICQILGLDPSNSQGNVSKAILELRDLNLDIVGHVFNIKTKEYTYTNKDFSLISSSQLTVSMGRDNGLIPLNKKSASLRHIVFDPFVVQLLTGEFTLRRKEFLSMKSGKVRRAYGYIAGKRQLFGNVFSFDLEEFSSAIGDTEIRSDNKKASATKVLKEIKKADPSMNFCVKAVYGQGTIEILIEFDEVNLLAQSYTTKVFPELVYSYELSNLDKLDFIEADYIQLHQELNKKCCLKNLEFIEYRSTSISTADFIIDLALFQIINTGYNKIPLKKLCKLIMNSIFEDNVETPEGYRMYVVDRNKIARKKIEKEKLQKEISKRKAIEEQERSQQDANYKVFYDTYIKNDEKILNKYKKKAESMYLAIRHTDEDPFKDQEEDQMVKVLMKSYLADKAYKLAKEDYFNNGDIIKSFVTKNSKEISFGDISGIIGNSEPLNAIQ